tara:strand:- start:2007 stop:2378 length:372 start_codon:yes stop_codon:yes gene_type:complete
MRLSNKNKAVLIALEYGYEVSRDGKRVKGVRVKRIKLQTVKKYGKKYKGFTVRLKSGQRATVLVHKLQAYKKYGKAAFESGIVVRHLNDNSLHNNWDNIALGTQAENMQDKVRNNQQEDNLPF